jgi:hypothetical protein
MLLTGCTGVNPPRPRPPVEPAKQAMAVVVVEFAEAGVPVEGVQVYCEEEDRGKTNSDGYLLMTVFANSQVDCRFLKDGYLENTASLFATSESSELRTWLARDIPPPPPHPNPLLGTLRIEGGCFRDDTGCVNPVYAHAGDLFSIFVRDPDRALAELDRMMIEGYHGARVWFTLGCGDPNTPCQANGYWAGREVGPNLTPGYWDKLRLFLQALRDRNLRAVFSHGDVGLMTDRRAYMTELARINDSIRAIDWLDCGNEAWQTGEPDPRKLAECVGYYRNAGGTALLTLTSPPGETKSELDAYSIPPADAYDVHSYRGGHSWDKRRHIFGIPYEQHPEKAFGINSEGPGNGDRVSVTDNKHELDHEAMALLGVAALYSRQAYVWFSGDGVILGNGLSDEQGWQSVPRMARLLPKDLMTFPTLFHSGDSWRGTRILAALGEVRNDGRINGDGRFVNTIDGPPGTYDLSVERSFTGQLCNPGIGSCEEVTRNAGSTLRVSFTRGLVLIGQVR